MEHLKIELKNVQYVARMSEETNCFTATLVINGKKRGTVSNHGHGGSNEYSEFAAEKELNEYAATLPPMEFHGTKLSQNADIVVGDILEKWLTERENKRITRIQTCFRLRSKTYGEGQWNVIRSKFSPAIKAYLDNKYGSDLGEILNETLITPLKTEKFTDGSVVVYRGDLKDVGAIIRRCPSMEDAQKFLATR